MRTISRVAGLMLLGIAASSALMGQRPTLVSINRAGTGPGNMFSHSPAISADGRLIAFFSTASDLVLNDSNNTHDVFVRDLTTAKTTLVSVNAAGTGSANAYSNSPVISANGRFVGFASPASDLVANDNNQARDLFVRDLSAGKTTLVSVNSAGTGGGNADSESLVLSADGRFAAFSSAASDLVANDGDNQSDVFVRDLSTGKTTLVSVNIAGTDSGNSLSQLLRITPDGKFVVFYSTASDLVANDNNLKTDLFVRDMAAGKTTLVSVNAAGTGSGNGTSQSPSISADGRYVAFSSDAPDLVLNDGNNTSDVFVRDLSAGKTTLVSVNSAGTGSGNAHSSSPAISPDGRLVAFTSSSTDLIPVAVTLPGQLYVRDLASGKTRLVSVNVAGTGGVNSAIALPVFSGDGRFVAFHTQASDLVANDNNAGYDTFVCDLTTGKITLVSVNAAGTGTGNRGSHFPSLSADGRYIAFHSESSDLVANDYNNGMDVFLLDTGNKCTFTITPTSKAFASGGGSGTVGVTTGSACGWTARSNASWIVVTSNAAGPGSKSVGYTVAANNTTTQRSGTLTIAGEIFVVTQPAPLRAIGGKVTLAGTSTGVGGVTIKLTSPYFTRSPVTTLADGTYKFPNLPAGKSYTVEASKTGMSFTPASKLISSLTKDELTANFTAATGYSIGGQVTVGNAAFGGVLMTLSGARTATTTTDSTGHFAFQALPATGPYTIRPAKNNYSFTPAYKTYSSLSTNLAAEKFSATPASCSYTISPASKSFPSAGGTTGVSLTTSSTCSWTARSNVSWISITSYAVGTGSKTVGYKVAANTSAAPRTGTLTVAGKTFTVTQAALSCTFSILPGEALVEFGGEVDKIAVSASTGCGWAAKSNAAWLTITSGLSGKGNGKVTYAASANTGTTSRAGTLTVAGKTFTVTQAAMRDASPIISPMSGRPGQTLTIQASGFDPAASTSVIFKDQTGYKMEMPALVVTSSQVKVLVPVYMNRTTLQTGPGTVSVSVVQNKAGAVTNIGPLYGYQITDLPQISLTPGTVTLAVLLELQKKLYAAAIEWQRIQDASNGAADLTPLIGNLKEMQLKFRDQEVAVRRLVDGSALSVPLGVVGGRQISLTKDGLALMDRIYVAFLLKGCPSCSSPASLAATSAASEDLAEQVRKEIAGAIYDTADGALEAGGRIRSVTNMVVKLGVFAAVALTAEVAVPVVAGVVLAAVVWNATTWVPLAHSIVLRSMYRQMNNGTATAEDFRKEGEFVAQAAYDGAKILDTVVKPISAPTLEGLLIGQIKDNIFKAVNHFNFSDPSSAGSQVEENLEQIEAALPTLPPIQAAITVGDDGLAADDAFQVVLDGTYIGETAVGASNTLNIDGVLPGPHTLTVTCTVAPDNQGTLSVSLGQGLKFEDGSTSKSEVLELGGSVSYTVIAP